MAWDTVLNRVHFIYVKLDDGWSHVAYKRNEPNNPWITLAPPPDRRKDYLSGNDMVWARYNDTSYLFVPRKPNSEIFYRYNVTNNTWTVQANLPRLFKRGSAVCWDGGAYIYALAGQGYGQYPLVWSGREFYRYSIPGNCWTRLADVNIGNKAVNCGSLAYRKRAGGDEIYAFTKKDENWFRRYNVNTNSWDSKANTPNDIENGSALIYMPNEKIYAFRGGNNNTFWRYNPDAEDGGDGGKDLVATFDESESNIEDVQDPGWSNDGQWVVYSKLDTITGTYQIFKRRPDGSEETQITSDESNYTAPKWAPDSNLIACIIDDKLGLIKADGSGKQILDNEPLCFQPSWSYDGKWITYIKWTFDDQYHKLYKIRRDASQKVCLSDASTNFYPQFSSDNSFIVYQKDVGFWSQIFSVPASGGPELRLTTEEVDYAQPQWSPSADTIVFVKLDTTGFYQIYKMTASGGEEIPLTDDSFDHLQPRFSPSGENIVYVKSHPDSAGSQICRKLVSGGEELVLTDYSTLKEDPEWSPAGDLIVFVEYSTGSEKGGKRISVIPAFPTATKEYTDFCHIGNLTCSPNLFNTKTVIRFANPQKRTVTLNIYNSCGTRVKTFTTKAEQVIWDGKDNVGKRLSDGIYFLRLEGGRANIEKLILAH